MPIEVPPPPNPSRPLALLGGLTPRQFLRRHWQKKPLLIRAALPGFEPLSRARLLALARHGDVESRLVAHTARRHWTLEHGPFERGAFPARSRPGWTLLVQGVDAPRRGRRRSTLYRDPRLKATSRPARIPRELQRFAADAVERLLARPRAIKRSLGELATEPRPNVVFDEPRTRWRPGALDTDYLGRESPYKVF